MNEREAVKWCARRLDGTALSGLLGTTNEMDAQSLTKHVTTKFDGDLQGLLAALPRASLVHLVEAWAAETPSIAKVSGLDRAKLGELKAALTEFLIAEWRIPVEQPSATPVAGGRLTVVKGAFAPISRRLARATWFTGRWREWVGESQFASQLLTHDYPDLFILGELLLLEAERKYYAVRDLEIRIAELKDAPEGLGDLDQQRVAAGERARAACEAMRADLNAGWLNPRVGPMIDRLASGLDRITDTDEELLRQRLLPAHEAMTRQARLLGELGPGIEHVLKLWGGQLERDFLERLSTRCGDAVVPLIQLLRHKYKGVTLASVDEVLISASTHAERLIGDVTSGTPFCYSNASVTVEAIWDAIESEDVELLVNVPWLTTNTRLSTKETWSRGASVVGAAARVLQILGLNVPIDPLYGAINANPQVRSETDSPGGPTTPPTSAKEAQ